MASSSFSWRPLLTAKPQNRSFAKSLERKVISVRHASSSIRAFKRSDFDLFAKRVSSGEAWRDAWRSVNEGFEVFLYESKKTAERIDRRYDVARRISSASQAAADRALELDRQFEITQKWRAFALNFSGNWPRYWRQFNEFLDTPLGRSAATLFFVWFALSGWLFNVLIFATCVLPFAAPFLIGAVANNLVIKGECPACKRPFVGYKNQKVQCASCGNIVWQPKGDSFSRDGGRGSKNSSSSSSSKSQPNIIDVEFEEK